MLPSGTRVKMFCSAMHSGTCVRMCVGAFWDLREDTVGLAKDPACIGVRGHQQLQCTDVDVGAQRPEVRLLQVVNALQLLHLKRTWRG